MWDQTNSHWDEISFEVWQQLWFEALSEIPTYQYSTFYLVTGLLLPVWDRLSDEHIKVYRLQTQCGQTLLGRMILAGEISSVYQNFGLHCDEQFTPAQIYQLVTQSSQVIDLKRWKLKQSSVAQQQRLELFPVNSRTEVDYLRNLGAFSEIINYQLRVFLPNLPDVAQTIIEQLM